MHNKLTSVGQSYSTLSYWETFKAVRCKLGLSREKLARQAKCSASVIYSIESGRRHVFSSLVQFGGKMSGKGQLEWRIGPITAERGKQVLIEAAATYLIPGIHPTLTPPDQPAASPEAQQSAAMTILQSQSMLFQEGPPYTTLGLSEGEWSEPIYFPKVLKQGV